MTKTGYIKPIVLVLVLLLAGCGDYKVGLPEGYSLVRVYAGAVLISDHARTVIIMPNVDGYAVYGKVVAGHVSRDGLPSEDAAMSKPGYFIVDTQNHETKQAMDKDIWLDRLRKLDINAEPVLKKPSRFDRDYD